MDALGQTLISVEEFFAAIHSRDERFELVNGQLRMMGGATNQHNDVKNNVTVALTPAARRSGCRSTTSDTGVRTGQRSVRMPDVVVDCGPADPNATTVANPTIIVEVSSPGTRSSDVGVKLAEYQSLPSVQIIIQIEPDLVYAAVHRRGAANSWAVEEYEDLADSIPLPPLDAALTLGEIYFGLDVKPRPKIRLVRDEISGGGED